MSRCPRCNCEATGHNRLVTDSCGHNKCRPCLLTNVSECLECKLASGNPIEDCQPEAKLQLTSNTTDNHIKITAQGYHCKVCKKSFRSRTQQYYHRACGNEMLKKFSCTQCNRRFASCSHLKYHLNNHVKNPKHICDVCGKVFKQLLVLERHKYVHKPHTFACQQCQRLFRTEAALTTHLLVHTGDSLSTSFKCETCSRHYLTKANLKQHMLKHDQNSIKYTCPVCKKSFLRKSTLRLHQKRHDKHARHSCPKCHKTFNDVDALSRHTKQHAATQSYRCIQCDVSVNRRDNMVRHLRSMHPGVLFDSGVQIIDAESLTEAKPDSTESSQIQRQRYNSVIKSVGNVEPVNLAIPQLLLELETTTVVAPLQPDQMQKENVKLYRKIILDLDNEEYSNELTNGLGMDHPVTAIDVDQTLQQSHNNAQPQHHQRVPGHGSSNFIERHWRKNFKYSYENEHTN